MSHSNEKRRARVRSFTFPGLAAFALVGLAVTLAACGGDGNGGGGSDLSGTIRIDGSSTVGPLTEAAAELFGEENGNVRIPVGVSGTGGGFEKFCAKETDINDASRRIEAEEKQACQKAGVEYEEIQVANDGIAVVVNPENDWAECLTTAELESIWNTGSKVKNWSQVKSGFPDQSMKLFGPGTDSGTFDYFTEQVNGEEGASRSDYSPSEDDNLTIQGVSGDKGNTGYLGLAYALENTDKLKTVQIDGGEGCVEPTNETVQNGSYKPLSRPLYIYPSREALRRPEVRAFVQFYVDNYEAIAEQAQFVSMTAEQQAESKSKVDAEAGT
jgi:phosphate transport system substrate-binding protein